MPLSPGIVLAIVALVGVLGVLFANRGTRQRHSIESSDVDALRRALSQTRSMSDEERIQWNTTMARLERLEHAVDTIAVEMERLGEGQRFVSRLLADSSARVAAESNGTAKKDQS